MAVLIPALGDPTRSYYGTDTRAQTVLVGAVAAILLRGRVVSPMLRRVLAGVGLAAAAVMLVCFAVIHDTDLRMYQGGFLVFALVATVVVVDAAYVGSPVSTLLAVRPLRWIGAISYGIYLWHWPIHLWVNPQRFDLPFVVIVLLRAALTIAIAWLSFHLVERPVRRWLESSRSRGDRPRRARSPWITIGAAVASIALAALRTGGRSVSSSRRAARSSEPSRRAGQGRHRAVHDLAARRLRTGPPAHHHGGR